MRHRVNKYIRDFLDARGFYEIETPILTKSTPEGARDYLVPSRVYPGNFYALPQSPQQLKQLLMVAGFEKYYQIARCFRDEDFRADRQAEFTQLDLEMSFIDQKDILGLIEELYAGMIRQLRPDLNLSPVPFPRFTYDEVMRRFGTDKPDIRYGMELADVTDLGPTCDFAVFRDVIASGGQIRGFAAPGGATFTRRDIDSLTHFVEDQGGKGLISIALLGEGGIDDLTAEDIRSPMHRFLSMELIKGMAQRTEAKRGDLLVLVADEPKVASAALDSLRREMAARLNLADPQTAACCFVVDFPLFDWSESEQRWDSVHHPFTAPKDEDVAAPRNRSGQGAQQGLRLRHQRHGGRRRQYQDSPARDPGEGVRPAGHRARGGAVPLRPHAGGVRVRRAAAWWHRRRPRPDGRLLHRRAEHPRGHRLPEDAERLRPDDGSAVSGLARPVGGAGHRHYEAARR